MLSNLNLLLGAGFSRNWGGWLANEVFEYLIGHESFISDSYLNDHLWKYKDTGGFESALFEWQKRDKISRERRVRFENALKDMFNEMNKGFRVRQFEFSNQRYFQVSNFLTKFDKIFTLNQDLLLEIQYMNSNIEINALGRFNGPQLPGMIQKSPVSLGNWADTNWTPDLSSDFNLSAGSQPIIKLHGSCNWVSSDSDEIMVIGGGKPSQIENFPILRWYFEEFEKCIFAKGAKLVIIGYSFGDSHINSLISEGVSNGLHLFIIDPRGSDLFTRFLNSDYQDMNKIKNGVRGFSRRSLNEIFGGDSIEISKIQRFIDLFS